MFYMSSVIVTEGCLLFSSLTTRRLLRVGLGLGSFPAGLLVLVVPRVDIFAAGYTVADEFRITIVAELKVSYYPSCSRIHVSLQLHELLRQPLSQGIKGTVGALITTIGTRIGFNCVEGTLGPVD